MHKLLTGFLISVFGVVLLIGAGCGQQGNRSNVSTDNPPRGNSSKEVVPDPVDTPEGTKYYISSTKELCNAKETPQICEGAGAKFFTDDKGCGCYGTK